MGGHDLAETKRTATTLVTLLGMLTLGSLAQRANEPAPM